MEKTRKWRKILAMMLTVVMMLQNAQSVMVFADVTNEQNRSNSDLPVIRDRLKKHSRLRVRSTQEQTERSIRRNPRKRRKMGMAVQISEARNQEMQQLRQRLPMQMYLQPLPRACSRQMSVEPPATSCR